MEEHSELDLSVNENICIFGLRNSGKSTLCKNILANIVQKNPNTIIMAFSYDNLVFENENTKHKITTDIFQYKLEQLWETLYKLYDVIIAGNKAKFCIVIDELEENTHNLSKLYEFLLKFNGLARFIIISQHFKPYVSYIGNLNAKLNRKDRMSFRIYQTSYGNISPKYHGLVDYCGEIPNTEDITVINDNCVDIIPKDSVKPILGPIISKRAENLHNLYGKSAFEN